MLHLFPFRFVNSEETRNGVLLDIPEDADLSSIAIELHTSLRPRLLSADLILLRFPTWTMRQPEPTERERIGISRIADRFPSASIRILSSDNYQHMVGENLSGTYEKDFQFKEPVQAFLDDLRSEELRHTIRRSDALLSTTPQYVFRLPSRVFSEHFIRVGNIQTNRHNLDLIFFWMLPHLNDVRGILVDTWSIGSIALNCSRLLSRYDHANKDRVRVEMRNSYVDGRAETRSELEQLARRVSYEFTAPFLSLFSAAMTGESLKNIASAHSTGGCPSELLRFLVLFRLGDNQIKINQKAVPELCNLSADLSTGFAKDNGAERTTIEIDRTTYFPVFVKEKEVRLVKDLASKNREFFDSYRLSNAIRIHADSKVGGQKYQHHGIYLDVKAMVTEERFVERLQTILKELERPPKIILIPPHDAGEALAQDVSKYFADGSGNQPRIVTHLDLNLPGGAGVNDADRALILGVHAQLRAYTENDAIMVLDDVVTTGSRLSTYQKRLRDVGYKGQIHYLVGVQRMPSAGEWTELAGSLSANNFGPQHTAKFVEEVVLPNWDEHDCPLCIESRLLDQVITDGAIELSEWTLKRAQLLRKSVENGLTENVFYQPENTTPLRLTPNSYFTEENAPQSVVLGAVAAAIQELREHNDTQKRLDSKGFPVRTVLAVKELDRYSDGILRAAILRSLTPKELRRSTNDKEIQLTNWAKKLLTSKEDDERNTQPEIALAIGLGKIPIESANERIRKLILEKCLRDLMPIIDVGKY